MRRLTSIFATFSLLLSAIACVFQFGSNHLLPSSRWGKQLPSNQPDFRVPHVGHFSKSPECHAIPMEKAL
jgi:hypothetical protein